MKTQTRLQGLQNALRGSDRGAEVDKGPKSTYALTYHRPLGENVALLLAVARDTLCGRTPYGGVPIVDLRQQLPRQNWSARRAARGQSDQRPRESLPLHFTSGRWHTDVVVVGSPRTETRATRSALRLSRSESPAPPQSSAWLKPAIPFTRLLVAIWNPR